MEHPDRRLAIWVKPKLVAEVFYLGRGGNGLLRQVTFKAIRADKRPATLRPSTLQPRSNFMDEDDQ
jgi:bifunctional non-homologous end joining protein LigD